MEATGKAFTAGGESKSAASREQAHKGKSNDAQEPLANKYRLTVFHKG